MKSRVAITAYKEGILDNSVIKNDLATIMDENKMQLQNAKAGDVYSQTEDICDTNTEISLKLGITSTANNIDRSIPLQSSVSNADLI